MLKTGLILLAALFSAFCHAQSDSINKLNSREYNLKLAYNSSLIYPGISAGIEFHLKKMNSLISVGHHGKKSINRARFISANINWYHHPAFHDNLYLTAEWVMRRTTKNGFISEFSFGPGFSRTFLGGTTYTINGSGDVSVVKMAGYRYALVTIGEGFGIDFSVKKRLPFSMVTKLNMITMFPYNSTVYFRPVLELGIRYNPLHGKNKLFITK
jgi:hypothetical protein